MPESFPISELSQRDEPDTIQVEDGTVLVNWVVWRSLERLHLFSLFINSYSNRHLGKDCTISTLFSTFRTPPEVPRSEYVDLAIDSRGARLDKAGPGELTRRLASGAATLRTGLSSQLHAKLSRYKYIQEAPSTSNSVATSHRNNYTIDRTSRQPDSRYNLIVSVCT